MRQTLCYIPETFFGLPLFGWGLGLAVLAAIVLLVHVYQYFKHRTISDVGSSIAMLIIGGILIVLVLPRIAEPQLGIPIRGYGLCLVVAICFSFGLVLLLGKRQNIPAEQIHSLAFWTIIVGILGARLFYVTEYWQEILRFDPAGQLLLFESLLSIVNLTQGGLTVFGSILGGILAASIFMLRTGMPVFRTFDIMAPAAALGIAIGRIGCLLNGCCFGGVSGSSWAITFPPDSPAHRHQVFHELIAESASALPVHPTQIYSSGLAFLLCITLLVLGRCRFYRERPGLVLASFMILYSSGRFMIEFVRTDEDAFFGTGLTISQNVSILFGLLGLALFVYLARIRRR